MLESTPEDFRPFIVVAPLSTLGNWEKEFELWVPEVNIVNFLGNSAARDVIKQKELFSAVKGREKKAKFHVLLTSYEIASMEASTLRQLKVNSCSNRSTTP